MLTIQSDRLTVQIAEPNVENNTCRFNRAGFITSVILDGKTEFCGSERGGSGGVGLCSEVTTDEPSVEAAVGENFLKIGVGLLKKPDERPYFFIRKYEVEPLEIYAEADGDRVVFITNPKPCGGYAVRERKVVSVSGNVLRVDYEVENTGEKSLRYSEYCHNFISTEYDGVTNSYNLTMPAANAEMPYVWELQLQPARSRIYGKEYFAPHHHNIWSPGFVISPEVYFVQQLEPGETVNYTREWEFEQLADPRRLWNKEKEEKKDE